MTTQNTTQTGFLPGGSYLQSCQDIQVTLTCQAKTIAGNYVAASLALTQLSNPIVWNNNGVLQVDTSGTTAQNYFQPGGSWMDSCTNAAVTLTCSAQNADGEWVTASYDLTSVHAANLWNDNGTLKNSAAFVIAVYTRSGYPASNVLNSIPNYACSSINTLILSGPNGYEGGIVYNDPPLNMFDSNGQYVGDSAWPASLVTLKNSTNIVSIYYSLSNSAISALAAMSAADLANVMTWLKSNGITGIDMDCENWGQAGGLDPTAPAVETVTLAAIKAGLALSAAPYNNQNGWIGWQTYVTSNSGTIAQFNVQCYDGGYGNDPVQWATTFPAIPIVAGFEANPGPDQGALTPDQATSTLQGWQNESPKNSLAGAFVWEYSIILSGKYSVYEYTEAMYNGLG